MSWRQGQPAEARICGSWIGTAEALPFHKTVYENSGKLNQADSGI
jgi:hypothetical protein